MMNFTKCPPPPEPIMHDPFMQEILAPNGSYHRDPRWIVVRHMRKKGQHDEAAQLVRIIKEAWGVD